MKTILITGSTDGIGKETAKVLAELGHHVIVHGRTQSKVDNVVAMLKDNYPNAKVDSVTADLSAMNSVEALAGEIESTFDRIDVLINNAGVYSASTPMTKEGLDIRFAVNAIAPYLLTKRLLKLMDKEGRVINLSSAAQATVNMDALLGKRTLDDGNAYAQSKLALTMVSRYLAQELEGTGPLVVAVNPRSFLGSKMVRDAYGMAGHDLSIGADILMRAALSDEFADSNGKYFDNDRGVFGMPHRDALDDEKCASIAEVIEGMVKK